jgi:hypothetical protein
LLISLQLLAFLVLWAFLLFLSNMLLLAVLLLLAFLLLMAFLLLLDCTVYNETIGLSDLGYRTVISSAIGLSEYRISD